MERLVFILIVSFGSLALGYAIRRAGAGALRIPFARFVRVSGVLKLIALVGIQPIPIINSFWNLDLVDSRLLSLPLLGSLSLVTGGVAAIVYIRLFRIPAYEAGSVFTAGMFTNIGTFGALIGYVLYGPLGFTVVQLFRVFEEIIYYAVGFPLSQQISRGALRQFRFNWRLVTDRPIIAVPIGAIIVGFVLRGTAVSAPVFLSDLSSLLVPIMTGILGLAIGLTLRITKIGEYRKHVLLVLSIKYVIIPAVIIPIAFLFGLHHLMDGVALRMVVMLSFLPTAFFALVPPVLYDFDLDLANSAWLGTTVAFLFVFPVVYFFVA